MIRLTDPAIHVRIGFILATAVIACATVTGDPFTATLHVIFWLPLYAAGLYCGYRNALAKREFFTRIMNVVAAFGMVVFVLLLFGQNLMIALLALILSIQAAQNFTLSTERELHFTLALSFVVLLFAASESKSTWFLLWIAVYAIAVIATLIALHAHKQESRATAARTAAGTAAPRTVGALQFTAVVALVGLALYLLLPQPPATNVGGFFARGGPDYRDDDWESAADRGGGNAVADLQEPGRDDPGDRPGERGASGGASGGGGSKDKGGQGGSAQARRGDRGTGERYRYRGFEPGMSIERTGSGRRSNGIVMYVRAHQPFHLRGRVFDTFDDGTWTNRHARTRKLTAERGEIQLATADGGRAFTHTIEMVMEGNEVLFAGGRPTALSFPGPVVARDVHGGLFAPDAVRPGTAYSVRARMQTVDGRPLAPQHALLDRTPYLQLPDSVGPRVAELARRVAPDRDDAMAAAHSLEHHLRNEYDYTFETVFSSQGYTPIEYFLFEAGRGHCEYFASAMAVMLRTLDIPSRLVTGFSVSNRNPVTGYYEVRALDGHAWVEAWIEPHGWVLFEPTPYYPLPTDQPRPDTAAAGLNDYVRELARDARTITPDTLRTAILEALDRIRAGIVHTLEAVRDWLRDTLVPLRYWLLGLLVLAALGAGTAWAAWIYARRPLVLVWARWQARLHAKREPREAVLACTRTATCILGLLERPRNAHESIDEYFTEPTSPAREPLTELAGRFGRARYSSQEPGQNDRNAALGALAEVIRVYSDADPDASRTHSEA